ncbi:AI-2E family transporter [bacterium]|nr:AI-2E family transporter [bacterium]
MNAVTQWFARNLANPQVVSLALVLLAAWVLITFFGNTLAPVLVAVVFAYLLEGPVEGIARRTPAPRMLSVLLVWTVFVTAMVLGLIILVPLLSRQMTQLVAEIPALIGNVQAYLMTLPEKYPTAVTPQQVEELMLSAGEYVARFRTMVLSNSVVVGVGVLYVGIYLVLVPLLIFFMLKDKVKLKDWFRRFLPKDIALLRTVWADVDRQLANYVRGKFVEILIVWAVSFATFTLLGLNYAVLLSALVGFSVLVPYLGALVATIPVMAVAYAQFGITTNFYWVFIAYGVIQALDGNVLVPLLFSEAVDLHPVAIIVAVLFFGGVWGFWGVFFAIPLATVVHAVIAAWPAAVADEQPVPESAVETG